MCPGTWDPIIPGMPDHHPSTRAVVRSVGGFLALAVVLNLVVRVVPLPDLDLPSLALPEIPGWLHTVVRAKNLIVAAVVVGIVVAAVVDERRGR
jgi:hypothetical protein